LQRNVTPQSQMGGALPNPQIEGANPLNQIEKSRKKAALSL